MVYAYKFRKNHKSSLETKNSFTNHENGILKWLNIDYKINFIFLLRLHEREV